MAEMGEEARRERELKDDGVYWYVHAIMEMTQSCMNLLVEHQQHAIMRSKLKKEKSRKLLPPCFAILWAVL